MGGTRDSAGVEPVTPMTPVSCGSRAAPGTPISTTPRSRSAYEKRERRRVCQQDITYTCNYALYGVVIAIATAILCCLSFQVLQGILAESSDLEGPSEVDVCEADVEVNTQWL